MGTGSAPPSDALRLDGDLAADAPAPRWSTGLGSRLLIALGATLAMLFVIVLTLERFYFDRLLVFAATEVHEEGSISARRELEHYLDANEQLVATRDVYLPPTRFAQDADLRGLLPDLWAMFDASPETGAIFVGTPTDEFIGYRRLPDGSAELMASSWRTGHTIQFHTADARGRPGVLTRETDGFYASRRPWFHAARDADGPVWSEVFRYHAFPIVALPHSVPIRDADGQLVAVLGVNLYLSTFDRFLSGLRMAPGSGIFVVDDADQIVASTYRASAPTDPDDNAAPPWLAQLLAGTQEAGQGVHEVRLRAAGTEAHTASVRRQRLESRPGIDWSMYSMIDLDAYRAANSPLVQPATIMALLVGLAGLLAMLLVVRRSLQPLEQLTGDITHFAQTGRRRDRSAATAVAGPSGSREVRELRSAFDHMSEQIDDLLARQRHDLALQQSLNRELSRLARIAAETDNMVIVTDPSGAIVWVNRGFVELTGYTLAEARGLRPGHLLQGEGTDPAEKERMRVAIDRGEPVTARLLNYCKDGTPYWNEIAVQPVRDELGEVIEFFSVQRDVTEQVSYEERLALWRNVFAEANWGILVSEGEIDPIVRDANGAAARLLGTRVEELVGRSVSALYAEDAGGTSRDLSGLADRLRAEPSVTFETVLVRDDGGTFPALVNLTQIRHGDVLGPRIDNIQDLTALRTLESQLAESNKLENVGLMASGILHDFNNILNVIQLTSELGQMDAAEAAPEDIARLFAEVQDACGRAAGLTRQFLTFTRREAQGFEIVSLGSVAEDVATLLRPSARRTAALTVESDEEARVWGSAVQLQQVLMNLVGNATTALELAGRTDGRVRVHVRRVHHTDYFPLGEATRWVRVDVEDDGPGIPAAVRSRVFEPLFTTKREAGGTGLGLAIVQRIIDNHDGFVACDSTEGEGTRFTFWLPENAAEPAMQPERRPAATGTPRREGAPAILVVDDEFEMAELWRTLLRARGWDLVVETDPMRALAAFRSDPQRFDLLVTDLAMPGMNGADLVAAVRASAPELTVLVYSAYVDAESRARLDALAVDAILAKPVSSRVLVESIEKLLDPGPEPGADAAVAPAAE